MILSKKIIQQEIEKNNIIADLVKPEQIKDQSIDVRLGQYLFVYDSKNGNLIKLHDLKQDDSFLAKPDTFFIAHTHEFIGTKAGSSILPSFKLKSSAGRLGIIHTLAGHGEVGFFNRWAMEFIVAKPVLLEYRALIGQIYFTIVEGAENEDYSKQGTYQKTNSLEDLKKSWTPESILPPERLKV